VVALLNGTFFFVRAVDLPRIYKPPLVFGFFFRMLVISSLVPVFDEVVVSTSLMKNVIDLNDVNGILSCQAGLFDQDK
jgi:hypothetical protein